MVHFYGFPKIIFETPEQQAKRKEREALEEIREAEKAQQEKNDKLEQENDDYGYLTEAVSTVSATSPSMSELRYLVYQLYIRGKVKEFCASTSWNEWHLLEGLFQKGKQWSAKKIAESEYRDEHQVKLGIKKLQITIANYLFSDGVTWNTSGKERYLERIVIYMYAHPSYSHAKIAKYYKMTEAQVASIIAWDKELAYVRDKYAVFEMDIMASTIHEYIIHHPEDALSAVYKAVCEKHMSMDQFLQFLKTYHIVISNQEPETPKELAARVQRLIDENPEMPPSQLAKELGWTGSQVDHFIKKNHLKYQAKRRKRTYLDFNQVQEYTAQHPEYTYAQIAKNFGVPTNSMTIFMTKYGIMKGGKIVHKTIAKHPSGRAIMVQKDVSGEVYTYETIYGTGKETTLQKAKDAARLTSFTEAEKQQGLDKGTWKWRNFS